MPTRLFACAFVLALLGSCDRRAPAVEADQPAAQTVAEIEDLPSAQLDDDALSALVRGATFRYAYEPSHFSESFNCAGGWIASAGSAPTEGVYSIANGRLCTTLGNRTTCRRIYQHNGNLYANPLAYADRERWAFPLVIVRRSSCS
jgi:hypothetical protein